MKTLSPIRAPLHANYLKAIYEQGLTIFEFRSGLKNFYLISIIPIYTRCNNLLNLKSLWEIIFFLYWVGYYLVITRTWIQISAGIAEGGNRTLMELPPADFESAASTSFTTSAGKNWICVIWDTFRK